MSNRRQTFKSSTRAAIFVQPGSRTTPSHTHLLTHSHTWRRSWTEQQRADNAYSNLKTIICRGCYQPGYFHYKAIKRRAGRSHTLSPWSPAAEVWSSWWRTWAVCASPRLWSPRPPPRRSGWRGAWRSSRLQDKTITTVSSNLPGGACC